jgi:hypothetical protein
LNIYPACLTYNQETNTTFVGLLSDINVGIFIKLKKNSLPLILNLTVKIRGSFFFILIKI